MDIPFALPGDEFARMARAVRKVEGLPPRREQQGRRGFYPSDAANVWIKATSATGSTVTLGGGTVTGYAAVWGYFDASSTGFTWTSNVVWFVPAPGGGVPAVNQIFECRLLGADTSQVPVWGATIAGASFGTASGGVSSTIAISTTATDIANITIPANKNALVIAHVTGRLAASSFTGLGFLPQICAYLSDSVGTGTNYASCSVVCVQNAGSLVAFGTGTMSAIITTLSSSVSVHLWAFLNSATGVVAGSIDISPTGDTGATRGQGTLINAIYL